MLRKGADNNNLFNLNQFYNLDKNLINNQDIDVDEHYFNSFACQNLGYLDTDQLNEKLVNMGNNGIKSIMHINARSLISNIDLVCANLKLLKQQFGIICVSETWACSSNEQFINIPGYDCICRSRSSRRGGGLALYIDSDLDVLVKNRPDLDSPDETVYESLIVQLSQPNASTKDIIVGVMYKPPNTNVETYLNMSSLVLDKLNKEDRPTYLLGDSREESAYPAQTLPMYFQYVFSRSTALVSQTYALVAHPTWLGWLFGVVLMTSHVGYVGFYCPISGYIPLCYFRHRLFWIRFNSRCIILHNSMGVDRAWRSFLGHLDDWQVGGACTRTAVILFFTVFGCFINV